MIWVTKIGQFILIISILVVLHELGHYLTAKWFKTKVEKFYLFFNPWFSLFKKKVGETEYGIGWLPMGGYVKIAGMIDESMDKEQMKQPPQPWEFRSKPAWQRLIIMLGGIIVNVLLAWLIYTLLLVNKGESFIDMNNFKEGLWITEKGHAIGFKTGDKILSIDGKPVKKYDDLMLDYILGDEVTIERDGQELTLPISDENLKKAFTGLRDPFFLPRFQSLIADAPDSLSAYKAGLRPGDMIKAVNGEKVSYWDQVTPLLDQVKNDSVQITVLRNEQLIHYKTPLNNNKIGVIKDLSTASFVETKEYGFLEAIPKGLYQTYDVLIKQIKQFKVIFKPKTEAYKQVKGPIGIVEMMPDTWDWVFFWNFTALFSVWLAFINLLPIPALDGGHAMFLIIEMIRGKAPSQKVLEKGQVIGFVIIMGLMVLVFGNDIWNIIKRFL